MCKLFVVNSLYLGNRSLGLELWDGKGVVEMTEKQVRDGLNSGKEIYGLKVASNGIDLDIDNDGFYMNNLVIHRHIGNYKPMFETENPVGIMYVVTGAREVKDGTEYDLINSRFEKKTVSAEMLKSLFLMGVICGGARFDGDKIMLAPEKKKTEPEKEEAKQQEEKKIPDKPASEEARQDDTKKPEKMENGTGEKEIKKAVDKKAVVKGTEKKATKK